MADALGGLEVDEVAMLRNLDALPAEARGAAGSAGAMIERALADWATSRGTAT